MLPPDSGRVRGMRSEAEYRDQGLSDAALNVRDSLEKIARQHPDERGPELVLRLAREYCRTRLKPKERNG